MSIPNGENISFTVRFEDGETATLTPDTTSLHTYFGELAIYDHVFIELPGDNDESALQIGSQGIEDEEDEATMAYYVFRGEPQFDELSRLLQKYDFPVHMNMREVHPLDTDAYYAQMLHKAQASGNP